ncbi:MAG TPA: AI-2E family transporter YdiK [Anaeromyxobacteraceae bacterium]|nr:AI-2E family transporter YdiK [Anaeromyxobacteraceae bacterium]
MIDRPASQDIPRITLGVLAIFLMAAASIWIMLPFLAATVWATMIVIATWPLLLALEARFGGHRAPATAVMLLALLALLVVPVWIAISAIADNADRVASMVSSVAKEGLPPPPAWVERLPLVGARLAGAWRDLAGNADSLVGRAAPHLGEVTRWLAARAGGIGAAVVQFILTVLISGVLYATGEKAALGVRRFLRRLAGERGENAARLAAKAVRAVALGIVVTALAQTAVAGIGLAVARVPHAGLLAAVTFVLCIAQVGPLLVLAPATIWLFATDATGRGVVLLVFGVVAVALDNFLRPFLIKRGADLPLLLILSGVIGGLISFGIVGLFVGPVVLAVTWTLVASWVAELDRAPGERG